MYNSEYIEGKRSGDGLLDEVMAINNSTKVKSNGFPANNYPMAMVTKTDKQFKSFELLVKENKNSHLFYAPSDIESNEAVCIISAPNKKIFQEFSSDKYAVVSMLSWVWPSVYGTQVSLTLATSESSKKAKPKGFVSSTSEFFNKVLEKGYFYFCIEYKGKLSPVFEANYSSAMGDGFSALKALNFENRDHKIHYKNDQLAFNFVIGVDEESGLKNKSQWRDQLTEDDRIKFKYAEKFYDLHYRFYHKTSINNVKPLYHQSVAKINDKEYNQVYINLAKIIFTDEFEDDDVFHFLNEILKEKLAFTMFVRSLFDYHQCLSKAPFNESIHSIITDIYNLFLMSPQVTNYGSRRIWFYNEYHNDGMILKHEFITLKSIYQNEDCDFWLQFSQMNFNEGLFFDGSEVPINDLSISPLLDHFGYTESTSKFKQTFEEISHEIMEAKQWSVPWGARVAVDIPNFMYMDIYQIEYEFHCVFWYDELHYLQAVVNPDKISWNIPDFLKEESAIKYRANPNIDVDQLNFNDEARMAIALVCVSVIRDFMVVEERESVFSGHRVVNKKRATKQNQSLSQMVYLPKVRYRHNEESDNSIYSNDESNEHYIQRHTVAHHLRKTTQASNEQLALAKRYNVQVPTGYTFVRPHERGGESEERIKIYRSSSASRMLFEEFEQPDSTSDVLWFEFERDMTVYLNNIGFEAHHHAANKNGDGGVDIYAYRKASDETYAVQCKCYAPHHPVGVKVIRELIGSLSQYPEGTKGMVITTSNFAKGAIELAQKTGIELIDGKQLAQELK